MTCWWRVPQAQQGRPGRAPPGLSTACAHANLQGSTSMADKKTDLPGPGISTYEEVEKILPTQYQSLLTPKETQVAITAAKRYIEDGLCRELNLIRVEVPLIVSKESGVNDYLDRDGSRTPVDFPCGLGLDEPIRAQAGP